MSHRGHYIGFGNPDDMSAFAHFHVDIQGDEDVYPDWNSELLETTRQIGGSSNIVTQVMGHGPARLTLKIWFHTRDDYRRFRSFLGTRQTLSLFAGFTSYEGDIVFDAGDVYERFHDTILISITDAKNRIGGSVECTATFQRAGVEGATW